MYQSVATNKSYGFWPTLKRTLFMASLYFRMIRDYNPDDTLLTEFNRLFHLVYDPQALTFPAMVCPLLWKEGLMVNVHRLCEKGDYRQAVEMVYGKTPTWLRYMDRETMVRDAADVLRRSQKRLQMA